jgi:hypothetical protein
MSPPVDAAARGKDTSGVGPGGSTTLAKIGALEKAKLHLSVGEVANRLACS